MPIRDLFRRDHREDGAGPAEPPAIEAPVTAHDPTDEAPPAPPAQRSRFSPRSWIGQRDVPANLWVRCGNDRCKDPIYRRHHHGDILFGLHYAFSENFILPLSHDEVVHGKRSILGRMPGDDWQRFANLRSYYAFMFGHPGKKLLFMGGEFGQDGEWNHDVSLPWHLVERPRHAGVQRLVRDLNRLYRDLPALHALDCEAAGFEWLVAEDASNSVFAWQRKGRGESERCVVVVNFTPQVLHGYRVPVPFAGRWREVLNTDAAVYGGGNVGNAGGVTAVVSRGIPELRLAVPPLAALFLVPEI